jgi:uncharacterized membrane protein YfcA
MHVYLPIAEVSVNVFLLVGLGLGVGFISGLFGVGGGFLVTPLLIFIGIPPTVAVATSANQIVATSVSGVIAHWRRGTVDLRMGTVLLVAGFIGSWGGVELFGYLRTIGQIDLVIQLSYVFFLGIIGLLMLVESAGTLWRTRGGRAVRRKLHQHYWVHRWPLRVRFRRSKLYISAIPPASIGILVGVLSAMMGVSGGFLLVPAMIYLLGMPTMVVVGTSLFQGIFVAANVTFLQAAQNQTVDIVLALVLVAGSVVGAQWGSRVSYFLRGEQLRGLLALIVLAVVGKLAFDLVVTPADLFSIGTPGRH